MDRGKQRYGENYCYYCRGALWKDAQGGWWCDYCWEYQGWLINLIVKVVSHWWKRVAP